jgi:amino acid transporter
LGLLVPSNDPSIFQKASTAGQSPFVLAFSRAGIKTLPSVINAVILTSAFSAGNSSLFANSRILYGLAVRGQAPKFFTKCTSSGLPYVAILVCGIFSGLAFLNVSEHSGKVFGWLINISAVGGLLGLGTMNLTYIRYCES